MAGRIFFSWILYLGVTSVGSGAVETHWGEAKNKSGQTVYRERHRIERTNGKVVRAETIYFLPKKDQAIAEMKSDYQRSISLPTYEFIDRRTGRREGLRYVDGNYVVYYTDDKGAEKSKVLKDTAEVFSCQGWHYFLVDNLDLLEKGGLGIKLLFPSELDFYRFRFDKAESTGGTITVDLSLASWVLSLFAPKLQLKYDKKSRRLLRYEGVSNILDDEGENQDVVITYRY